MVNGQRARIGLLATIAVLSTARIALGQATLDERAREALKACTMGKVDQGIELLADLYADTGDATAIFNQGRCYQQNDLPDKAISRFKEYLRVAKSQVQERRRQAQRYIEELQAEMNSKPQGHGTPPPPRAAAAEQSAAAPPPPRPADHPPIAAPPVLGPPVVTATAEPPAEPHHGLRIAGAAAGAVALTATAAGVFFSLRVRSLGNDLEHAGNGAPLSYEDAKSKWDAGKSAQALQWVGYGVAVAAAGAAVTLFVLGSQGSGPAESHALAFAPLLDPTTVGGSLRVHF